MHAIKGAWVGKTFAVSSCNDSGGRKPRIRRSKEERKAMVETFITTYQKSNNGKFPSVSLTHKEVGGSFYTVREVVREIIQENRVLGPAKFPSEGQNDEHPFFSLSVDHHSSLSSTDAIPVTTEVALSHYQSTTKKNVLESNGQFHRFDNSQSDNEQTVGIMSDIIEQDRHEEPDVEKHHNENTVGKQLSDYIVKSSEPDVEKHHNENTVGCSDAIERNDNTNNDALRNLLLNDNTNNDNIVEAGNESQCSEQIVDGMSLTVEKVEASQEPIYIELPVTEIVGDKEDETEQLTVSKAAVPRKIPDVVVEKFPLRPISMTFDDWDRNLSESNGTSIQTRREHGTVNSSKNPSCLMNKQVDAMHAGPTLEMNSEVMNMKVLESSLQTLTPSNEASTATDFKVTDSSAEIKTLNGSSDRSYENLVKEESIAIENRPGTQEDGSSNQKGNNPPLDRINLETWKETTRTSAKHEPNPLFAFFKSLITAIVKILD